MASRPLVLAHRGACRRAPENTIEAFRIAGELGADGVELDVRRTRDGVLVVSHDPVVEGFGLLVEHPFEALRAAVPNVPTLEEAFAVLDGLVVNVEIKCFPTEPDADPERIVARGVVALLDELAVHERLVHERVIVSSFELDAVDAVRALDSRIVTGWLTYGLAPQASLPIAAARGHAWLNPDRASMLGPAAGEAVRMAADLGVRVDVWTVDDPDEITALATAGVHAIITNTPDIALVALADARRS